MNLQSNVCVLQGCDDAKSHQSDKSVRVVDDDKYQHEDNGTKHDDVDKKTDDLQVRYLNLHENNLGHPIS